MEYQLTKKGKEKVISFIKYCEEILLAESSILNDETKLPDEEAIVSDIALFIDKDGEYLNSWGITDYANSNPLCLKENIELIIDDAFTIMGVGTVATGNILIGMCREGENACIYKANGDILESRITTVDVHTKERKANGCGYKTEHVGLGLRGISKEQLEKGDKVIVKNANMYGM